MASQFKVVYTDRFESQSDAVIHHYLNSGGSSIAGAFWVDVKAGFAKVLAMPEAYTRFLPEHHALSKAYRFVTVRKQYRVVYRIDRSDNTIYFVGIHHNKSDLDRIARDLQEE